MADRRSGQQEVIKSTGSHNFVDNFKLTLALKTVRMYLGLNKTILKARLVDKVRSPTDAHIVIPITCEYVMLHSKGKWN